MLPRWISTRRRPILRQGELPFLRRSRRLDRAFKATILGLTGLAMAGAIAGTSPGRRLIEASRSVAVGSVRSVLGLGFDREEFEGRRDRARRVGIASTREALGNVSDEGSPAIREFLRATRLDRDSAVIRWGNYDWTLALSADVFEPDDVGRSYRLRPNTRSIWLIGLMLYRVQAMFEIPDTPEARRLGEAAGGRVVPESAQTTNSWGCRGPEPDPEAPVRVLVLGDSNMQGVLVGDDQTPPARLEARLREDLGQAVSVLNSGTLGYSPEQYYHTLLGYNARFRPQFVVVSLCGNDFGDMKVAENWVDTDYWLDAITLFCRAHEVDLLVVPLPAELSMLGRRDLSVYPGKVTAIFDGAGVNYLDPIEEFTAEHLELRADAHRDGREFPWSPLFNRQYNDHHLSPRGSDLWARLVARRLRQIRAVRGRPPVAPASTPRGKPDLKFEGFRPRRG